MNILLKILLSALLIGAITEIARRNSTLAALLASLPLISLLSMIFLYHETHDVKRISDFSFSVVWYVLPSLALFALLPLFLNKWHLPFYLALLLGSAATVACFFLLKLLLKPFGVII